MADESNPTTFTAAETTFLISMLKNLDGDIKFDADAVAAEMGYKDSTIARNRWSTIKRKKIANAGSSPTTAGVKKTPVSGKKTPAKKTATESDGGDTPTKPKRGRKPKAQKAVKEEEGGEEEIVKAEVMDEAGEEDETGGL